MPRRAVLRIHHSIRAGDIANLDLGLSLAERMAIEAIEKDMWELYRKTVRACVPEADAKIYDTFQVMRLVIDAMDQGRRTEERRLKQRGDRR
jgi:hypothetical protein